MLHQAGHTVYNLSGGHHVFSSFGSGTMRGVPTYWSSNCTFSPIHFLDELESIPVKPKIYIDLNCPVTTHYDVLYNRATESTLGPNRNGSCGVGFGATIDRQRYGGPTIKFTDLLGPETILRKKLILIKEYYRFKINVETDYNFDNFKHNSQDKAFLDVALAINNLRNIVVKPVTEDYIFSNERKWDTYIFEGAQGVLLDQDYGKAPNITKSYTTSRNAIEMLARQGIPFNTEIYYVTRAYHTRHGAGAFREQGLLALINNETESNTYNQYQQDFKIAYLDVDLVNYALQCDIKNSANITKNLVVTCLDHLETDIIHYYKNNKLNQVEHDKLATLLTCKFSQVLFSKSIYADNFFS